MQHCKKNFFNCFIFYGNNSFLLQENIQLVLKQITHIQCSEHQCITLDKGVDWQKIFILCQTVDLFCSKRILIFTLDNIYYNTYFNKQMCKLYSLLNKNLVFIFCINKIIYSIAHSTWFKNIKKNSISINCNTPTEEKLISWIMKRAKTMYHVIVDYNVCQVLLNYYEGDLLGIAKILDILLLIYPNCKIISLDKIKQIIDISVCFTPIQWMYSILSGNFNLSRYILQHLKVNKVEPLVLLKILQSETLLLIKFSRQMSKQISLFYLFKIHNIKNIKYQRLLHCALKRVNQYQLYKIIKHLFVLEVEIKQNFLFFSWSRLDFIVFLLCKV